jgi:hypothetical protein
MLPTVKPHIAKLQLLICAHGNTGEIRKGQGTAWACALSMLRSQ